MFLALTLALTLAHADVPPPPGYVETCTVEIQEKATQKATEKEKKKAKDKAKADEATEAARECKSCSAYFGGREPCEALEADGYTVACKSRGASTWTEVLCKDKATDGAPDAPATPAAPEAPDAPDAPDAPEGGAMCSHLGAGGAFTFSLLLPLIFRRRD